MSTEKKKWDLKKLVALTSTQVFDDLGNNNWKVKKEYEGKVFGRCEKGLPNVLINRTKDRKVFYLDDFHRLSQKTKGYIVNRFHNNKDHNNRVLYLVETEIKPKAESNVNQSGKDEKK